MTLLTTKLLAEPLAYTGEQLRSHWAYRSFDCIGDSAVAFIGPCDVAAEHMRDVEDLRAGSKIYSEKMLHFIIEHFNLGLNEMIWRQRAFISLIAEELGRRLPSVTIRRAGSDLYDGEKKLTVSIASVSPVSALIHAGINVSSRNTPVPTRGLEDYGIPPEEFARAILESYEKDCLSAWRARCKVRGCP